MVTNMGELDGTTQESFDDVLLFDWAGLARRDDDDEQFERWLADVSILELEHILDGLLGEYSGSPDLTPAS
jgi:hypothetical protein